MGRARLGGHTTSGAVLSLQGTAAPPGPLAAFPLSPCPLQMGPGVARMPVTGQSSRGEGREGGRKDELGTECSSQQLGDHSWVGAQEKRGWQPRPHPEWNPLLSVLKFRFLKLGTIVCPQQSGFSPCVWSVRGPHAGDPVSAPWVKRWQRPVPSLALPLLSCVSFARLLTPEGRSLPPMAGCPWRLPKPTGCSSLAQCGVFARTAPPES